MRFYLGTDRGHWLASSPVSLMVSRRTLERYKRVLPRAVTPWVLDSGGFTEVALRGGWSITPAQYAAEVVRFRDEIGMLEWAAPMDLMCEPAALRATGSTVAQHQIGTVEAFGELRARLGDLVIPVLQGWSQRDYLAHIDDYARAGFDLRNERLVGVGSICRRQDTEEAAWILHALATRGLALHAFGLKLGGLALSAEVLESADSMAWSFRARRSDPLPGHRHRNCSHCLAYALEWRAKVERLLMRPRQTRLAV